MRRVCFWLLATGICLGGLFLGGTPAQAQDDDTVPTVYEVPVTVQLTVEGITKPVTVTLALQVETLTDADLPLSVISVDGQGASAGTKIDKLRAGKILAVQATDQVAAENMEQTDQSPAAEDSTDEADSAAALSPVAVRVASNANLRAGPGTGNAVVGQVKANDTVQAIGISANGDWVQLEGGEWIAASLLDKLPDGLAATPAAHEASDWTKYELLDGKFSFSYPPKWEIRQEKTDSVNFKQEGTDNFFLLVSYLDEPIEASNVDGSDAAAVTRFMKSAAVDLLDFSIRFEDAGKLDGATNSYYTSGIVTTDDDSELQYVQVWTLYDDIVVTFSYVSGWPYAETDDVLAELTDMAKSVKVSDR